MFGIPVRIVIVGFQFIVAIISKEKYCFSKNKFEDLCCKVQLQILPKITQIKTKAISDGYNCSTSYASSENSKINTSPTY